MFNDEAFLRLVKEKGLKLNAVAREMGITPTTLYRKRKGLSEFTRLEIARCCTFVNESDLSWIFFT